jgi:hypothetical protein
MLLNMGMSYKSPLGKLPRHRPSKYKVYNEDIIPEYIRLADGRIIPTKDITNKITNKQNYNIRKPKPKTTQIKLTTVPRKYSPAERLWQSQSTLEEIQIRYGFDAKKAYGVKYQAQAIVEYLVQKGELIIDDSQEN